MLQVSGLSKSFGSQTVFEDVSFTVSRGERVGLVGRNGYGKTTLFLILTGRLKPDSGAITMPRGYRIGYLSQEISFSRATALDEAVAALPLHDDGRDESYKARAVLEGLGFGPDELGRDPSALSGGFQVRLMLARILLSEPDLLLLDEPTNYLDILSIRWLRRFLVAWKKELILITHDRGFMDSVTTHTIGIHRRRVRKVTGGTDKLYDQTLMEEEVHERTRQNDERKRREIEEFISRFRVQARRASTVQSRIKMLERTGRLDRLEEIQNLDFSFSAAPFAAKQILAAENVTFGYGSGPLLIRDFTIYVRNGDRIAVIGRNGRGKTTLVRLLTGELSPLAGTVRTHPEAVPAHFGQSGIHRLSPTKTVEEELIDAHPDHSRNIARSICGAMMFEGDSALKKIAVLSGGEKSRVLLGKLLLTPCNLLVLDEPTNHLDMESVDALIEAIEAFPGAVIIVTHSERFLDAVAERLIVFDDGSVSVFDGTYHDFLERQGWSDDRDAGRDSPAAGAGAATPKKDERRQRAQLVVERSRILTPLKNKIGGIECKIMELEKDVERDTAKLVDASNRGEAAAIAALSKSIHAANECIEQLFDELERFTSEYEDAKKKFEANA